MLISRWWQALLYNPGGFRQEFHAMRLDPKLSLALAGAAAMCLGLGGSYQFWSALAGMPLLFAGLGLAHWMIARFRLGTPVVVLLYIAIPLIAFSAMILMILALIDSLLDIRNKLKTDPPPQQ
jgi:predicted lysophospholipase L1 biosynthesis ABC-type transport system permease subunit